MRVRLIDLAALFEYGKIDKSVYEQAISDMFSYFSLENINHVWIKFHPEQYANSDYLNWIRTIVSKYKRNTVVKELSEDSSLELIAGNKANDVKFYVFLSSVAIYAGLCGREVYSFANFVGKQDDNYKCRINSLPGIFLKYVKFL